MHKLLTDVSKVALLLLSAPTPGVISSTYSIWVVFVNVSRTGTSALNFKCSSCSRRDLMCNNLLVDFWTFFDKRNTPLSPTFTCKMIITISFEKYTSISVAVSIFLFQACHLVILMLLLAQCHKTILRPLQPLSFTFCDRSSFYTDKHNQFLMVTVHVSNLNYLQLLWSTVVSCLMPSIISGLVYDLINVAILAFVDVCCICVTNFAPLGSFSAICWLLWLYCVVPYPSQHIPHNQWNVCAVVFSNQLHFVIWWMCGFCVD